MVRGARVLPNEKKQLMLYRDSHTIYIYLLVVVLFAIFLSIVICISPLPTYGHPIPLSYEPKPNQLIDTIETLPDKVDITFTERPELKASSIRVMNLNNERIDNHDLKVSGSGSDKSLSVSLDKSKLVFGDYTIKWLVFSKDDGFITKGSYVFSIARIVSQN